MTNDALWSEVDGCLCKFLLNRIVYVHEIFIHEPGSVLVKNCGDPAFNDQSIYGCGVRSLNIYDIYFLRTEPQGAESC